MGLLFKKVVNRNITPPEQKQVDYALTYFETKRIYFIAHKGFILFNSKHGVTKYPNIL